MILSTHTNPHNDRYIEEAARAFQTLNARRHLTTSRRSWQELSSRADTLPVPLNAEDTARRARWGFRMRRSWPGVPRAFIARSAGRRL